MSPQAIYRFDNSLQVLESEGRIGSDNMGSYKVLKSHPFFQDMDWEGLPTSQAPKLVPYLPALDDHNTEDLWSDLDQVLITESDVSACELTGLTRVVLILSFNNRTKEANHMYMNKSCPC